MSKILLVDDNVEFGQFISEELRDVWQIDTYSSAKEVIQSNILQDIGSYDCIIVDVHLPEVSGKEFIERVRQVHKNVAILALSSDNTLSTKLDILSLGINDYLSKTMDFDEIRLRVSNAILLSKQAEENENIVIGNLRCDQKQMRVYLNEELLDLSKTEYKILSFLVSQHPNMADREELAKFVWDDKEVRENTVNAHISKLKKLKLSDWDHEIKSKRLSGIFISPIHK